MFGETQADSVVTLLFITINFIIFFFFIHPYRIFNSTLCKRQTEASVAQIKRWIKPAQATPTKEWIDYRVRVKHFPKSFSFFPVTLLAGKQAGSSQTEDRDSAQPSTRVNHQKKIWEFNYDHDSLQSWIYVIYRLLRRQRWMCLELMCRSSILQRFWPFFRCDGSRWLMGKVFWAWIRLNYHRSKHFQRWQFGSVHLSRQQPCWL